MEQEFVKILQIKESLIKGCSRKKKKSVVLFVDKERNLLIIGIRGKKN